MSTFSAVTTFGMRQVVARAARHADALIAVTAAARDEIVAELGLDPARFIVVPHGATRTARGRRPRPSASVRERSGSATAASCCASPPSARTRTRRCSCGRRRTCPDDVAIVLAGHPEPYDAELRALAAQLGVDGSVIFAGYVPDAELEALWGMAGVRRVPDARRGLRAARAGGDARGVPVACSDLPVLREVGGELPRFFEPDDPAGAARGDRGRARRRRGRSPGARERAAGFTWAAAAAGTWEAYERALRHDAARRASTSSSSSPGETGGMEVAARELIPHLAAIDDLRVTAFVNREAAGHVRRRRRGGRRARGRHAAASSGCAASSSSCPALAARPAATSCTRSPRPRRCRGRFKRVTTIHDLNYRFVPGGHFGVARARHARARAGRRAALAPT